MSLEKTYCDDGTLTIQHRPDIGITISLTALSGAYMSFITYMLLGMMDEIFLWVMFILAIVFFLYCIRGFFAINTIEVSKETIVTYSKMGILYDQTILVNDIEGFEIYVHTFPKGDKSYDFCVKLTSGEDKMIFYSGDEELVNDIAQTCQDFIQK